MKRAWIILSALLAFCSPAVAKLSLPSLVGDGMVLQQNAAVTFWGSTTGTYVKLVTSWDKRSYKLQPDASGAWSVQLRTPGAGGPYSIRISDNDESIALQDVLVGEVWICSGQSNMEMPVGGWPHQRVDGGTQAIAEAADTPLVRMFTVARNNASTPQEDCTGAWKASTRDHLPYFSATAYFFGKTLSRFLPGVPIGLIATDWGGTPIEAWMSVEALERTAGIDLSRAKAQRWYEVSTGQLFNGMIYPLRRYAARGFIWYQGEANLNNSEDYPAMTLSLVNEWRALWKNPDMPYYLVQLAPFAYNEPDGTQLPLMVEQQYRIPALVPHCAVAATTDIGHRDCIHPPYKKEVGERLAYLALTHDYGVKGLPKTPEFQSLSIEGSTARLRFSGVSAAGDSFRVFGAQKRLELKGFEIAGEDRIWYPASARVEWEGNDILVWSEAVPAPVAVRYAFRNWPEGANVVTESGLPLPMFRTDNWR